MKKLVVAALIVLCISLVSFAQSEKGLRVFISVDMEGISGAVNWEEMRRNDMDYDYFRNVMTREASAAVAGAYDGGATYVVVRDSHGSARNILPEELDKRALLLRDWSGGYKAMMEGIDATFDAVVFIGYHDKAGTPNGIMAHTMSSARIEDVSINGVSLPEAGINALIAGTYDVPVAFLAGDQAICDRAEKMFPGITTVSTKQGIGTAELGKHPTLARREIRAGVAKALKNYSGTWII